MLALLLWLTVALPAASGQTISEVPELGAAVVEDSLLGPGLAATTPCPTGLGTREFTVEGFQLSARGRCLETNTWAGAGFVFPRVHFLDGEARLDFKVVSGDDRLQLALVVRSDASPSGGVQDYRVIVDPARGMARLARFGNGPPAFLAERADLAGALRPDDWNNLAIRTQGTNLWVLLNDQPILFASDAAYDAGRVSIVVSRRGSPDDEQEVVAVVRNLRVAGLAGGDQARIPTYQHPVAAAPAPSGAPRIGRIYFTQDPDGSHRGAAHTDVMRKSAFDVYAYIDFFNVTPPNTLQYYWMFNGEIDNLTPFSREWIPSIPTGYFSSRIRTRANSNYNVYTLVVKLNGVEATRADLLVQ
jgi:hypothetical protein